MDALLTAIVVWLATTFELPPDFDHPRIETVPATEMSAARYHSLLALRPQRMAARNLPGAHLAEPPVFAFYNDATRTLYLPDGWSGNSPAELSMLVHEMVHHLQTAASLEYPCPEAREGIALIAQERWLEQFGLTLESEFGLDPLTILVRTRCMF